MTKPYEKTIPADVPVSGSTGPEETDFLYHFFLTGPDGAHFILYREDHHTDDDFKEAKRWLRRNHNVLSIKVERI